ncbi:MAG TPA: biopolymer transporter ExbD [Candidatus Nitrosotenuis sp.]|jgi:biopolymer transport protein ExbD|nr:biopolymer transporter ExbD [Candidatus Nitrosotenuis sp.]
MAVAAGSGQREEFSEINVTPLTDVLLVLLIIFLITGSAITQPAHNITLPEVVTREKAENAAIVIDITREGKTYVGQVAVSADKLEGLLSVLARRRQTDRVVINADHDAYYGAVVTAMDAARGAGLEKIALATDLHQQLGGSAP